MTELDHEAEVDRNFEAFQEVVGGLMTKYAGMHALMRNGNVDSIFKTASEALVTAYKKFPDGLFSVQEVADRPLDLGFYSHVARIR